MLCSPCTRGHPQVCRWLYGRLLYTGRSRAASSAPRMEGFWKRMTCRVPGCIGHCRPPLLTVVLTVIPPCLVHPTAGSAVSSLSKLSHSNVVKLPNDPCFQKGQHSASAMGLAACQNLPDIDRDAPLIPASTIKLVTSAAVFMRLPPHHRFHTKSHTNAPLQNGVLEGGLSPQRSGDPGTGDRGGMVTGASVPPAGSAAHSGRSQRRRHLLRCGAPRAWPG